VCGVSIAANDMGTVLALYDTGLDILLELFTVSSVSGVGFGDYV
jgi:hypothetical protein